MGSGGNGLDGPPHSHTSGELPCGHGGRQLCQVGGGLPGALNEYRVVSVLVKEICQFGRPRTLHTDQGCTFKGKVKAEVTDLLGIRKTRTSPTTP